MVFGFIAVLFLFTVAALALIAYPVLVAPVCDDPVRCVRGRLTYWFMLAGYCSGGLPSVLICDSRMHPGYAFVGLVVGAVVGNLIGRFVACGMKLEDEEARA